MTNINPNDGVNKINANIKKETKVNKNKEVVAQSKQVEASALNALNSYGKASINFKGAKEIGSQEEIKNLLLQTTEDFVTKLLNDEEKIQRIYIDKENNNVRTKIGLPIQGFKDLYDTNKHILVCFDKNNEIKNAFQYNPKTKEIDVFSKDGELTHHYTKEDYAALHYYKYHPDSIHSKLRYGQDMYGGSFLEETNQAISQLNKLFTDDSKVFRTTENRTLYRALQNNLSEEEIAQLSTIGGTYTDKSFCSTTEELATAKRFSCGNPILKINAPKNTKYIDVERLFNIDHEHWNEQELLLDRNSQFVVKDFDPENNIIEVDLIQ